MSTNSKQNTTSQDEIDLLNVFVKLGKFTRKSILWLISMIGSILIFVLRKWLYFSTALLLTVLSAYILNKTVEPFFHSNLIIRSNATTNQTIMISLDKLGDYAKAGNYAALSDELDLSLEEAGKIKGLETFWLYDIGGDGIYDGIDFDDRFLSDTSIMKLENEFVIRISIMDTDILESVENSLVKFLETRPYLISLNEQRLIELEDQLQQTNYEIEKLDSLQKREYYTNTDLLRQKESQIVFTSEKTVRIYHNEMFKLLELKQECERELNIYGSIVTVIEGFSVPLNPENGTIKYGRKLIWYFMGLALVISVLVTFRKKIWNREQTE